MIYLGADHRGFNLKEHLKKWLKNRGLAFEDLGALTLDPNDDYPLIAEKVARKVAKNTEHRGVLLCGSGAGVCIAANKIDGIRASEGIHKDAIKAARSDDDINVLCLSADLLASDEAQDLVDAFLNTPYSGEERHERRLKEIKDIEENN